MIELDPSQLDAVDLLLRERVGVITGPPGSGKTTIIKSALELLPARTQLICCAPTGKAAKRIMEATGFPAGTVHRVLGAHHSSGRWTFTYDGVNEFLPYDLVLIDEASMLSADLAAALLRAVNPSRTRVFFVGDVNQLPSVGPGHVLSDMIGSDRVPVAVLDTVHRSADESWVCANAPKILEGDISLKPQADFRFLKRTSAEQMANQVVELVTKRLADKDVQVLTPQNAGPIGVDSFNARIQAAINPAVKDDYGKVEPMWKVTTSRGGSHNIRARDRVIATRNDYDLALFNGESGIVREVKDTHMVVDFDGRNVWIDPARAEMLRLAYALTVHRSQGSEWDWVVVVCHSDHSYMWSRQLLYTAVTRAKRGVMLVGDEAGIRIALHNDAPAHRVTTLLDRLVDADAV